MTCLYFPCLWVGSGHSPLKTPWASSCITHLCCVFSVAPWSLLLLSLGSTRPRVSPAVPALSCFLHITACWLPSASLNPPHRPSSTPANPSPALCLHQALAPFLASIGGNEASGHWCSFLPTVHGVCVLHSFSWTNAFQLYTSLSMISPHPLILWYSGGLQLKNDVLPFTETMCNMCPINVFFSDKAHKNPKLSLPWIIESVPSLYNF